jgi:hypothetical protein
MVRGELTQRPESQKSFRIRHRWTLLKLLHNWLELEDPPTEETIPFIIAWLKDRAKKQRRKRRKGGG